MESNAQLQNTLLTVAGALEKQIDNEIDALDNMNISEFEQLRNDRLKNLKKQTEQRILWKSMVCLYQINLQNRYFMMYFRVMVYIHIWQKKNNFSILLSNRKKLLYIFIRTAQKDVKLLICT